MNEAKETCSPEGNGCYSGHTGRKANHGNAVAF